MSFRDDYESSLINNNLNHTNTDNSHYTVSFKKNRNSNMQSVKNSSNKKKSNTIKIIDERKGILNDKNKMKTPQSTSSRIKRGLTVN